MYMHTCVAHHFDCHFIAVTTVLYAQMDNVCVHVLLYSVHACACTCAHAPVTKHKLFCARERRVYQGDVTKKVPGTGR